MINPYGVRIAQSRNHKRQEAAPYGVQIQGTSELENWSHRTTYEERGRAQFYRTCMAYGVHASVSKDHRTAYDAHVVRVRHTAQTVLVYEARGGGYCSSYMYDVRKPRKSQRVVPYNVRCYRTDIARRRDISSPYGVQSTPTSTCKRIRTRQNPYGGK